MKFYIYTLGCKVNTYESAVMRDLMLNAGYVEVSSWDVADIYIVNTCTVTNSADHKSLKVIRQAIRKNPHALIVAVGCLVQNNQELVMQVDGVDVMVGNIHKSDIVGYVERFLKDRKQIVDVFDVSSVCFEPMKLNNFDRTRAFVKIQDGCNNFCSYCIIPYTRGNVRSKKPEDVIEEITSLVHQGHREVVLTGIHTGNYGAEFDHYGFSSLLRELVMIDGLERLRISSIEVTELNDDFLKVLRDYPILVDHMHIPLQSGSNSILKLMNRKYDKEYFMNKMKEIRSIRPDISITTDVIVGFPYETEELFLETVDTICQVGFSKLHVFPYSKRTGTVASTMDQQVDEVVKKERVRRLLSVSHELEVSYMERFIGNVVTFIPEVWKDGYLIGHTGNYLLVKALGDQSLLYQDVLVSLDEVIYPYCVGNIFLTEHVGS